MTEEPIDTTAAEETTAEETPPVEGDQEGLPEPTAVAVREDADVFRRMDLEDERQIMEELQGRALDVMLYSFEIDGKRQTGFSWKGAREAVRTLNYRGLTSIRLKPEIQPRVEEFMDEDGDEAYRVTVYAEDQRTGGGQWGIATAKKRMPRRRGDAKPDTFAVHKALSKAQRNAYEGLIPIELVEYLKAQYLGEGQVKAIPGAAGGAEIERPPPLADERADAQRARMRELYDEIKAIDRLVMPPGQFHLLMQNAEHSHERLDEAIESLQTFLAGERDLAARREEFRALVPREVFEVEVEKMRGLGQQRRLGVLAALVERAEQAKAG